MKQGLKEITILYVTVIACMGYVLKVLSEVLKEDE